MDDWVPRLPWEVEHTSLLLSVCIEQAERMAEE